MLTHLRYLGPSLLIGLQLAACFPDDTPPAGPPTSPTCGNGVCEVQTEDCARCPQDCSCCAMVDSRGRPALSDLDPNNPDATNLSAANGEPDGRVVQLDENSDVTMAFGLDVFDRFVPTEPVGKVRPEIRIHGEVQSEGAVVEQGTCPVDTGKNGVFEVLGSADGIAWRIIGLWGKTKNGVLINEFDVACASSRTIRWIRVKGHRGALGTLDAVTAINDDPSTLSCLDPELQPR